MGKGATDRRNQVTTFWDPDTLLLSYENGSGGPPVPVSGFLVSNFADGLVGTPGANFVLDPDTGLYRITTNTMGFAAGGVEQARVDTGGFHFKGGPWFDVKAYGAKGDRTTDDTVAIQAALTAANFAGAGAGSGGATVFFPAGTYKITDTLLMTGTQTLLGTGNASLIVQMTAGKDVLQIGAVGNAFAAGCAVQDLTVYGVAGTRDGIVVLNAHYSSFTNVKVAGAGRYGWRVQSIECSFTACQANSNINATIDTNLGAPANPTRGFYGTSSDTPVSSFNANTFTGCLFAGANAAGSFGALIDTGTTNAFVRCQFEGNDTGLSFSTTSVTDNVVIGCGFDSNLTANFVNAAVIGNTDNVFIGCHGPTTNMTSPTKCTDRYTLASDAKANVWTGHASLVGIVTIVNYSTGTSAQFECVGAGAGVVKIYGNAASWSATKDNASTTNVYWDAGNARIEIQNKMGVSRNYEVWVQVSAV